MMNFLTRFRLRLNESVRLAIFLILGSLTLIFAAEIGNCPYDLTSHANRAANMLTAKAVAYAYNSFYQSVPYHKAVVTPEAVVKFETKGADGKKVCNKVDFGVDRIFATALRILLIVVLFLLICPPKHVTVRSRLVKIAHASVALLLLFIIRAVLLAITALITITHIEWLDTPLRCFFMLIVCCSTLAVTDDEPSDANGTGAAAKQIKTLIILALPVVLAGCKGSNNHVTINFGDGGIFPFLTMLILAGGSIYKNFVRKKGEQAPQPTPAPATVVPADVQDDGRATAPTDTLDHIDRTLTTLTRNGRSIMQGLTQIRNKVDPFDRYAGLEKVSEARRSLVRRAIDYSYEKQYAVVPLSPGRGKAGKRTLASLAELVWKEYPNHQVGFTDLKDFKTALNEQAHRNERSFLWEGKE